MHETVKVLVDKFGIDNKEESNRKAIDFKT